MWFSVTLNWRCGFMYMYIFTTVLQAPSNSMYGGLHTVTLIPGDGIGPELAACVKKVFRCVY